MNLILFETPFEQLDLSADDPRTLHILKVLKIELGGVFYVGFINGPRALGKLVKVNKDASITLSIVQQEVSPACLPIDLLIGMPRPHTAKRVLFEASCLGVRRMHFFQSDNTEPSYMQSRLWKEGNYKERLMLGAEQSFTTHVPEIQVHANLETALSKINHSVDHEAFLAMDNYEAGQSLGCSLKNSKDVKTSPISLAFGSERGWSDSERSLLLKENWKFVHLGTRVLRLEMAVVSAIAIAADALNLWTGGTGLSLSDLCD